MYHELVALHEQLRALYGVMRERGMFVADLRWFRERMRLRESGRYRIGIQTPSFSDAQQESGNVRRA